MKTDLLHVYSSDLEESSPLELRQADRTPPSPLPPPPREKLNVYRTA